MNNSALGWLLATKAKNSLKNLIKKPSRIIFIVIILALLAVTVVGGQTAASEADRVIRDKSELTALLNALLIFMFATSFYSGLNNGGGIFKMADVNLLFPSPLGKRNVLFFALIQQIGASMLIGVFILFQYTTLHAAYDLSGWGLALIFLVYSLTIFLSQSCATLLYTFVSDSDRKKNTARRLFILVIVFLLAYVAYSAFSGGSFDIKGLTAAGNSLPVKLFPFAGWMGAFAGAIMGGQLLAALGWLALCAGVFALAVWAFSASGREYYEDVIASAESVQETLNSASEGVVPEAAPRHISVKQTGIGRGAGASVVFWKHLLENRRSTKLFVSTSAIVMAALAAAYAFFVKDASIVMVFSITAYMQLFTVSMGRFAREMTKPYIYLIPEPPMKKMIWAMMETMPTALVEGIVIFVPVTVITGASALDCAAIILARISFAAIFLAGNLIVDRIWGGHMSKMGGVLIFFLINILLCLPGLALMSVLSAMQFTLISSTVTAMLSLAVCNLPLSLLIFFLCRGSVQCAEMQ